MYTFSTAFFLGGCGWELSEIERLYVCLRTAQSWSQNCSERGVGSGWRRGGMVEDINVCEDRGGYCLVALVSGYLLVYFFLSKDGKSMEKKGVQCGSPFVPDVNFVPENEYKLHNPSAPEGYVSFSIPSSFPRPLSGTGALLPRSTFRMRVSFSHRVQHYLPNAQCVYIVVDTRRERDQFLCSC